MIRTYELSLLMLGIYLAVSSAVGWYAHHYAQTGVKIDIPAVVSK